MWRYWPELERRAALACLLACGALAACAAEAPTWSVDHETPAAALLSVHSIAQELYVVGADDGVGPVVLRRDRAGEWERLYTGDRGALWWVTPDVEGRVLLCGEGGRVLQYDPERGHFTAARTPRNVTVYGAWVSDDGVAFAVGGDVFAEERRGALWVRRGGVWSVDERVDSALLESNVIFKVWGTNADDVWAVGERGTVLHLVGDRWTSVPSPERTRILTVHGDASGPIMVGGSANGVILEFEGLSLVNLMPDFLPGANGVFVAGDGRAWVVGNGATVLRRDPSGAWTLDETVPSTLDLHAVTVDHEGTVWAVGGALLSPAFDRGVVLRLGR